MTGLAMSEQTTRPLDGMRVLDLLDGPMGTIGRQLAELGAEVIRIESPGGAADRRDGAMAAGVSLDFIAANLGKRATTGEAFEKLAPDADVLLCRPGTDIDNLRLANPRLVVMMVSDFGAEGRFAHWRGSDAVFHALSGELARSGLPGRPPLLPPGRLALACAATHGVFAVLTAYYNALRTGVGDRLDFSVLDGAVRALDPGFGIGGSAVGGAQAASQPRGRIEARQRYPIVRCKDGFVRLCVLSPKQWRGLFEWLGRPEEFADPSFARTDVRMRSKTLLPAIERFMADRDRRSLEAEGQGFGVPIAMVLDLEEALGAEQARARQAFRTVEIAAGVRCPFPDGVIEIDGVRMGTTGPAPQLEAEAAWARPRAECLPFGKDPRPLAGLKVLDFGVIVVGAEAGRLLADQGADVIKVETSTAPDGSRQNQNGSLMSFGFAAGHRNKRSLGLNVRSSEGKRLLHRLVAQSDVLLSNFKGGTSQSLGLDYETLRVLNPRIIVVDSSAFGSSGPWSDRMGYGPLVRASAGLTMQWRYEDDPESFSDSVTVYPDHAAGRVSAIGVLALLIRRVRTGLGGQAGVSQAEVMLDHLGPMIAAHVLQKSGHDVTRREVSTVFQCAGDDEWCAVTIRNEGDAEALAKVMAGVRPAQWFLERDRLAVMEVLQAAGVPSGAMLRVAELPRFPYFEECGLFRVADHPHVADIFFVESSPVRSEHLPEPEQRPAPIFGEHTAIIAAEELGLRPDEVAALVDSGVLEVPPPNMPAAPGAVAPATAAAAP
jgi:crotonobetainyl-CoA:carnitine CoA-transferase CaiB-like acyl-CoA transferase